MLATGQRAPHDVEHLESLEDLGKQYNQGRRVSYHFTCLGPQDPSRTHASLSRHPRSGRAAEGSSPPRMHRDTVREGQPGPPRSPVDQGDRCVQASRLETSRDTWRRGPLRSGDPCQVIASSTSHTHCIGTTPSRYMRVREPSHARLRLDRFEAAKGARGRCAMAHGGGTVCLVKEQGGFATSCAPPNAAHVPGSDALSPTRDATLREHRRYVPSAVVDGGRWNPLSFTSRRYCLM